MFSAESLYEKLRDIKMGSNRCLYTLEKCEAMVPLINKINALKAEKNAIVLAHSYVSPDIIHGVADFVGDSYELSKKAKETDADTIIFSAVRFMADTAKLLNPKKTVIIPSRLNGCTLADSITGDDVKALRKEYPEHSFVCYINTSAEVKAQCDVCVTSSNVYDIVETLPNDKIYFLPDRLMGENVIAELNKRGVKKDIVLWDGRCYVHEAYDPEMINFLRQQNPGVSVLSHPECNTSVLDKSDFVGSTSQMITHVKQSDADSYFMLTECGLINRLELELPQKRFIGSCTLCKYMKSNSLEGILTALSNPHPSLIIEIDSETQRKALACIEAMFHYADQLAQKKA